jgi:hypothetical protein
MFTRHLILGTRGSGLLRLLDSCNRSQLARFCIVYHLLYLSYPQHCIVIHLTTKYIFIYRTLELILEIFQDTDRVCGWLPSFGACEKELFEGISLLPSNPDVRQTQSASVNIYPNNIRSIHHLKTLTLLFQILRSSSSSPTQASQLRNAEYIKPFLVQHHPRQIPNNRKRARLDVGALRARLPTGVSRGDTLRNHRELHQRAPKKKEQSHRKLLIILRNGLMMAERARTRRNIQLRTNTISGIGYGCFVSLQYSRSSTSSWIGTSRVVFLNPFNRFDEAKMGSAGIYFMSTDHG